MLISNNATAGFILGTLNNNLHKKNKAAGQLSLGEKIRNAGDDASGYAISERMRVRLRSLDQADANVQNGASMLRIAEGAIQSQINLLRTVKEKVIDAHNDTNTDADRVTIQKEITEYYNEINDIAAETTFNGKHLLLGTKVVDAVKSWYRLDHEEKLDGSDTFGFISNTVADRLDGQEGPFAIFGTDTNYDGYEVNTISTYTRTTDGTADTPRQAELWFSTTFSGSDLQDKAFKVIHPHGESIFVFSNRDYYYGDNVNVIKTNDISDTEEIISRLRSALDSTLNVDYVTTKNGMTITLTTKEGGVDTDNPSLYDVAGVDLPGGNGRRRAYDITKYVGTDKVRINPYLQHGADGATAAWKINLENYNTHDTEKVEEFIREYVGKAMYHSGNEKSYEFIDSSKSPTMDSIYKINGSTVIDLNNIRSAVNSGATIAAAFVDLLTSSSNMGSLAEAITNSSGQVVGVNIKATVRGTAGNDQSVSLNQGRLRHYDLNFGSLFESKGISDDAIAGALDGKGFRFYDINDKNKWVNVLFVNGLKSDDKERPASGTSTLDIDTLVVDVSDVTDLRSFLNTLYEGDGDKNPTGLSQLLQSTNPHFQLAIDYDKGTMTIYDDRRYTVYDGTTQRGAKIADGIMDNVVFDYRNSYVNDLVIQHTDKSSANIHVQIPQTTMDHIFGYKIGDGSLDDYSVLTAKNREFLLGQDYPIQVTGALDRGIQYLIDANTLIGAQIVHMESADANIVTELENTTAAESVIRDADIAKSAMDMATANILSQSTMAMLSQFNQNSSDVFKLLQ